MDQAADSFRTAQCDFVWDQYQKVVDDHELPEGHDVLPAPGQRRANGRDITSPDKKYVLFTGNLVSVYQPPSIRSPSTTRARTRPISQAFLVLGFGGRGRDLEKSFDVNYAGMEQVQGVNAAKLELTPKSQRVRSYVPDDHAVDRPSARCQCATEVFGTLGRLSGGQVQQYSNSTTRFQATSSS